MDPDRPRHGRPRELSLNNRQKIPAMRALSHRRALATRGLVLNRVNTEIL
jgi:hypothetical protein